MILITGASGFLGRSILNFYSSQDISILSLGRTGLNEINCDLSSEIPNFNVSKIELVIHAAGKAHKIPKTKIEVSQFFEVNIRGTQNLLISLEQLSRLPKYFVFISTVAVYGKECGDYITENEKLKANDPYGLSKIQAEQIVKDWCNKNKVVCTILRLPLLVGKNPPGNLGAMLKGIKKGFYFNIGGGKAKKSMVLTEDIAQFIPIIAPVGGTYNLTDGVHPSFADLSHAIAKKKINNLPISVAKIMGYLGNIIGEKAPINSLKIKKITSNLTFDDAKARELGWSPQSVLEYLKNNDL
jgi:nucleoside-diphosphate-sugar epimerase